MAYDRQIVFIWRLRASVLQTDSEAPRIHSIVATGLIDGSANRNTGALPSPTNVAKVVSLLCTPKGHYYPLTASGLRLYLALREPRVSPRAFCHGKGPLAW